MSRLPRACPECRAPLDSNLAPWKGKVRCHECGVTIASERGSNGAMQSKPETTRPVVKAAPLTPGRGSGDLPTRHSNRSLVTLLCVGLGLCLLGLLGLLLVGGEFAFWATSRQPAPATVVTTDEGSADAVPVVPVIKRDLAAPQGDAPAVKPPVPPIGRPPFRPGGRHPPATLTIIFRSSSAQSQALPAVLVADDMEADLAVLKVTGVQDTPW